MRTGYANLPLHPGKCPAWLFGRMKKMSGVISEMIINEYGSDEFLRRLSNPYFFQALGCVIGFDWHSSGLTPTTCGALKEALNNENLGIKIAGGKGKTSKKAPDEIIGFSDKFNLNESKKEKLVYSSKMSAKVDNSLIQDSYELYHHCFIFNDNGSWAVIQQGMNTVNKYARRYHWLSDNFDSFVLEPHNAICCDEKKQDVLNMTSKESIETQKISVDLIKDNPKHLERYIKKPVQRTLNDVDFFTMQKNHYIVDMDRKNIETLQRAYEIQPKTYEELVAIKGVGAKTIRSLALISDLVYGKPASWKDPVKYSFAHGGKDSIPYPVDKKLYDENILLLRNAIRNAKLGEKDKLPAIKRLREFY